MESNQTWSLTTGAVDQVGETERARYCVVTAVAGGSVGCAVPSARLGRPGKAEGRRKSEQSSSMRRKERENQAGANAREKMNEAEGWAGPKTDTTSHPGPLVWIPRPLYL